MPLVGLVAMANVRLQSSASVPVRSNVLGVPWGVVWLLPLAIGAALVTVIETVAIDCGLVPSVTAYVNESGPT